MARERYDTFSYWGTVAGAFLLLRRRTRRAGGLLLTTVGLGGLGVLWDRSTGCRLSNVRAAKWDSRMALTHLPQAAVGIGVLWRK